MPLARSSVFSAVGRVGALTDDLACEYSAMQTSSNVDEAFRLFVAAEQHLKDDEDADVATQLASEAKALFAKADLEDREAEACRLIAFATLAKVDQMRYSTTEDSKQEAEAALTAEHLRVEQELRRFRAAGSKKGEACMLLSLADLALESRLRDDTEQRKAFEAVTEAKEIFHSVGDTKFEVHASITSIILLAGRSGADAQMLKEARAAVSLAKGLSDRLLLARAMHTLTHVLVSKETWKEAFRRGNEALEIYKELGLWKWQALLHSEFAEWHLSTHNPLEAAPHAEVAKQLFNEHSYGKGWQAAAMDLCVRVLLAQDQPMEAIQLAKAGTSELENKADKRTLALGYDALCHAHLGSVNADDWRAAQDAANKAVMLAQEIKDARWESCLLFNLAHAHMRLGQIDEAIALAERAGTSLAELGDVGGQGAALLAVAEFYTAQEKISAAILAAEKAAGLFQQVSDGKRQAAATLHVGILHAYRENLAAALGHAEKAQKLAEQSNEKRVEAAAWNLLSQVLEAAGNCSDALAAAKKMRFRYAQVLNHRWQAIALYMIAHLSDAEGKLDASAQAANEAVACARRLEDTSLLLEMLILAARANAAMTFKAGLAAQVARPSIAVIATHKDKEGQPANRHVGYRPYLVHAMQFSQEAVAIATKFGTREQFAAALLTKAHVSLLTRNYKVGRQEAEDAASIFKSAGEEPMQATCLVLVGHACKQQNKTADMEVALSTALEIYERLGDTNGAEEVKRIWGKEAAGHSLAPNNIDVALTDKGSLEVTQKTARLSFAATASEVQLIAHDAVGVQEEDIALDEPLMNAGLDSLTAVSFRERISKTFDLPVAASVMFDYPSLRAIAEHLVELSEVKV